MVLQQAFISDWRTTGGFRSRWLIFCPTDSGPQTQGTEPQIMSKSSGESLLCGRWTVAGLLPGHAAPRLFEELKARGGSLRDLHLHLHAPGSATVSALVCRESCVQGTIDLRFKNPTHGRMPALDLAKKLERREETWETVNVYVCARMLARDGSCSKPRAWVLTPCVKRH